VTTDDAVEVVRRWELSGGHWRVLADEGDRVTVSLLTCDGGEEMSRVESDDEALRAFLAGRASSEE